MHVFHAFLAILLTTSFLASIHQFLFNCPLITLLLKILLYYLLRAHFGGIVNIVLCFACWAPLIAVP